MERNGVVAKLLFLISVYEFPVLLKYYLFNYLIAVPLNDTFSFFLCVFLIFFCLFVQNI